MKNVLLFIFAFTLLAGIAGCDIVDDPVCVDCLQEGAGKKVLIEDFTGHRCGNCPQAHAQLKSLKASYGDDLVIVSVHAGGFAFTRPSQGYNADYTTNYGDELELFYGADLEGLPIGMVNRRVWEDGNVLQKFASWSTQINTILQEEPVLTLAVAGTVVDGTNMLEVDIDANYLAASDRDHRIVVQVTEDSIVSKQSDYSIPDGYVSDYVHEHMLRKTITGTELLGQSVKAGPRFAGETIELDFAQMVDPAWDTKHLHIVAFVIDAATQEIVQVEEVKVN